MSNKPVQANRPVLATATAGGTVAINELISCVNIALGNAALGDVHGCDVDGRGMVPINELIAAVQRSAQRLRGRNTDTRRPDSDARAMCGHNTPGHSPGFCGDGFINVPGEELRRRNNFGRGCAANCTCEVRPRWPSGLGPELDDGTATRLQAGRSKVSGHQALIGGMPRDTAVFEPGGQQLFNPASSRSLLKAADCNLTQ